MVERAWAFVPDPGGGHRSGISIECSECGASAFFAPNSGGRFPKEAARAHFERDGWNVGNGPRRDMCPACVAKKKVKVTGKVIPMKQAASVSTTTPRTMSRDDRRLIYAEIEGCYDKEAKRYMDGWHDERVAQSLGAHVPVAWVREIREDFFGDSGSNDQFDAFLKKYETAVTSLDHVRKLQSTLNENVAALQKCMDELTVLSRDVRKAIGK